MTARARLPAARRRQRAGRGLTGAVLGLLVACATTPGPELGPRESPKPAPSANVAPASDAGEGGPSADASPSSDGSSDAGDAAAPSADAGPRAPGGEGETCSSGDECESGLCEGAECSGECVSASRKCSTQLAWYCGCDQQDFQAPADCPGRRFAYRAHCKAAKAWGRGQAPDGAPCLKASQCKSGVCEGEGCDDAHPGSCQPAGRGCGQSAVQYCGCDGRSFSSNPCPGVRYEHQGFCPVPAGVKSVVTVLAVTGKNAELNTRMKRALTESERLRRCHLSSGEKRATGTLEFGVDDQGRVQVQKTEGLVEGSFLARCISVFARLTAIEPVPGVAGVTRVRAKVRFELTAPAP